MTNPGNKPSNGITSIDELANTLKSIRDEGRRVVHCHGVFDLLHIGHIRHFEQARKMGDVLVVTVTPDRYVNKGPHRPAFSEDLRADAVAALECVDYVAINRWPTATETIRLLRPDFYVKGSEYQDNGKDITGGIDLEGAAIQEVGGKLAFTDDITFSSSNLINRNLQVFPEGVKEYLEGFSDRFSGDDILAYLDRVKTLKVLVVGEAIIDVYSYCEAMGKSSKEPMLAVKQLSSEQFPGGILAVGNNVANFCDRVGMVTVLGKDNSQEEFISGILNSKIDHTFIYRDDAPTLVKKRFIEEYHFTKLLEVYEMNDNPLSGEANRSLCSALEEQIPDYDAVIVVDFGHGMLSSEAVDILCEKSRFLALNCQSNAGNLGYHTISKYLRADLVCVAEPEIRMATRDRHGDVQKLMLEVSKNMDSSRVVVTQGAFGCVCYSEEEGFTNIPAFTTQVRDRMGTGDAFLSIAALCASQNAPMEVVGFIGNVVGAQAAATVGHRTSIERLPLIRHIQSILK